MTAIVPVGRPELERAIRFELIPRGSKLNLVASPDLGVVLVECAKRYSTALELADDLRRVRERLRSARGRVRPLRDGLHRSGMSSLDTPRERV